MHAPPLSNYWSPPGVDFKVLNFLPQYSLINYWQLMLQALLFNNNNNLKLSGLNVVNSPRSHVNLNDCKGVSISGLKITAPGNSPNTDGIDVSCSSHVSIVDSTIGTGNLNSSFPYFVLFYLFIIIIIIIIAYNYRHTIMHKFR
jgi:hypothetical protein